MVRRPKAMPMEGKSRTGDIGSQKRKLVGEAERSTETLEGPHLGKGKYLLHEAPQDEMGTNEGKVRRSK